MSITNATKLAELVGAGITADGLSGIITAQSFVGRSATIEGGTLVATQFSGNISGVAATFTGNVSIAGTLTYEDVTNVDSIGLITARNGIIVNSGGVNVTGVVTASGGFVGNLTGTASTASFATTSFGLSGIPDITVRNIVGSALTITGISTFSSIGIGTTNPTSTLQVTGGDSRFGGVIETVSAATTTAIGSTTMVLEMDVRAGTSFTYTMPSGANIGIVSFRNVPAQTGRPSGTTITLIVTQNSAGTGNTSAGLGIGTNCSILGYENGANVTGISTRALVATASTVTLSGTASDVDFVSFFIHYNGGSNTTASNYKVYVTNNGNFRRGVVGV